MDSSIYGGNDMISLLDNSNNSLWVPSSSSFNGTMMNFDQEPQQGGLLNANAKRNRYDNLLARTSDGEEDIGEDESDANGYNHSDKKRRLTQEQVKYLEKSFEVENKLEPERKAELAKLLGLQPRQVAVWFQNRRARSKTKQIEKEFETLKANYFSLKDDYDSLYMEKEKLQNEVELLKKILAKKEGKETKSNIDIILQIEGGITNIGALGKVEETESGGLVMSSSTKQAEDVSSTKSDIVDSGSPYWKDGSQSAALQVEASSALMRDLDQQPRLSPEDEEHLMISNNLLMPQSPPTFNNFLNVPEDVNYDPNANSCNFSLVDDQHFLPWLY